MRTVLYTVFDANFEGFYRVLNWRLYRYRNGGRRIMLLPRFKSNTEGASKRGLGLYGVCI